MAEIFDEAIIFNLLLEGLLAQHQKGQYSVDSRRGRNLFSNGSIVIVLISALEQSDSVVHTFAFFIFFSIMVSPRRLGIAPHAIL